MARLHGGETAKPHIWRALRALSKANKDDNSVPSLRISSDWDLTMSLRKIITRQFEHPQGMLGRVVGYILATRGSNLLRNRWTVDLLAPSGDERVLEIGCGAGGALGRCLAGGTGVRCIVGAHAPRVLRVRRMD